MLSSSLSKTMRTSLCRRRFVQTLTLDDVATRVHITQIERSAASELGMSTMGVICSMADARATSQSAHALRNAPFVHGTPEVYAYMVSTFLATLFRRCRPPEARSSSDSTIAVNTNAC